jgi:hypothetical protein
MEGMQDGTGYVDASLWGGHCAQQQRGAVLVAYAADPSAELESVSVSANSHVEIRLQEDLSSGVSDREDIITKFRQKVTELGDPRGSDLYFMRLSRWRNIPNGGGIQVAVDNSYRCSNDEYLSMGIFKRPAEQPLAILDLDANMIG